MKSNSDIRNNINSRIKILFVILIIICSIIIGQLFSMQILSYDYYQNKVINNIQQETVIEAVRGIIYDRNMMTLAANATAYRVFISPVDIQEDDNENKDDAKLISSGLSEILGVEYDDIFQKTQKPNRKDETIKNKVDKDTADEVRSFIDEYGFETEIYLQASSVRYYPNGDLAANVIGSMGTDSGLFGIELQYDSYLSGTDGKYITIKNGQSQSLPSAYDYYVPANDGLNVVTTIDSTLQQMLEAQLYNAYVNAEAGNKVAGIVMDVNTGEILAMGQYPTANLSGSPSNWFTNIQQTETGAVLSLEVGGVAVKGADLRTLLGLRSTTFTIDFTDTEVVFSVTGYGHGVGLSQYGANVLAEEGWTCEEILERN